MVAYLAVIEGHQRDIIGKIAGPSSVAGDEERKIDDRVGLRERRGAMGLGTILLHGIPIARPHNTRGP